MSTLQFLVLGAALFLILGAGTSLLLVRQEERKKALQRRIDGVSGSYHRVRALQAPTIRRRVVKEQKPLLRQVAGVFGIDSSGRDGSSSWYVVLPVALAVAVLAAQLTNALLGDLRLLAAPPFWVLLTRAFFGWRREKRLGLLLAQFPDALAMIVRSVRVGIPVAEAVRVVSRELHEPTATAFTGLSDQLAIGVPLEEALPQMAELTGLAEYRFFATAIGLQSQTGGALGEVLDNLADVIRRRAALKSRGKALSSEARASALILAVLPVVVGIALYVTNPGYMGTLLTDEDGRKLFGLGIVSLATGLLTMRMIVKRVLA